MGDGTMGDVAPLIPIFMTPDVVDRAWGQAIVIKYCATGAGLGYLDLGSSIKRVAMLLA